MSSPDTSIYLEVEKLKGVVKLRKYISETGYELVSMNKTKEKTLLDSDVALTVVLDMKSTTEHQNVLDCEYNNQYRYLSNLCSYFFICRIYNEKKNCRI